MSNAKDSQTSTARADSLQRMVSLPETRQQKFESLPEPLRRQYYHQSGVHMHVSAYIYGHIDREKMMEMLCTYLVDENARSLQMLTDYARWFGAPTVLQANDQAER